MNYFWIFSLVGGVLILVGFIIPWSLVEFEHSSSVKVNVWTIGIYYIQNYDPSSIFSFSLTTILTIATLCCAVMMLYISNKGRKNVRGLLFVWLIILPTIVVFMPFFISSVVNNQKLLFASMIEYPHPLDEVKITESGSLLFVLFGALIAYNAVWIDLFYRLAAKKRRKKV
jgi:hypothetical protein